MINDGALWILMDDMSYWCEINLQRQADIVAGGLYIWGAVSLEVLWVLVDLRSHWFGVGGIMIPLVWCWQNCDDGGIVLMEPRRHWYVVDEAVWSQWCSIDVPGWLVEWPNWYSAGNCVDGDLKLLVKLCWKGTVLIRSNTGTRIDKI